MKKAFSSIVCSTVATLLIILIIEVLGTQTDLEIFSFSRVQNCILLFIIFTVASSAVEIFQEIGSLDPILNFVLDMSVAIITTRHYYLQGIYLFDGLTQLQQLLKYLSLPLFIVIAFSFVNFTSTVQKAKG